MKVAIANNKGGVGKSTIAMNVADCLGQDSNVILLDADDDGTSLDHFKDGKIQSYVCQEVFLNTLLDEDFLQTLDTDFDHVIIDCPPYKSELATGCMYLADFILIPVEASGGSLRKLPNLLEKVQACIKTNNSKAAFMVSRKPNSTLGNIMPELLNQFDLPVFNASTSHLTAYNDSLTLGTTVLAYRPRSKAADEIRAITKEILSYV